MTKRKRRNYSPWKQYMPGNVGDTGFYITTTTLKYGPFINSDIAEFFNLIAQETFLPLKMLQKKLSVACRDLAKS